MAEKRNPIYQPFATTRHGPVDADKIPTRRHDRHVGGLMCDIEGDKASLSRLPDIPAIIVGFEQDTGYASSPTTLHLRPSRSMEDRIKATVQAGRSPWQCMSDSGSFPATAELVDCDYDGYSARAPITAWTGSVKVRKHAWPSCNLRSKDRTGGGRVDDFKELGVPSMYRPYVQRAGDLELYRIKFTGHQEEDEGDDDAASVPDSRCEKTGRPPTTWKATAIVPAETARPWLSCAARSTDAMYSPILAIPWAVGGWHDFIGGKNCSPAQDYQASPSQGLGSEQQQCTSETLPHGYTFAPSDRWRQMLFKLPRVHGLTSTVRTHDRSHRVTLLRSRLAAFVVGQSEKDVTVTGLAPDLVHIERSKALERHDRASSSLSTRKRLGSWDALSEQTDPIDVSATFVCGNIDNKNSEPMLLSDVSGRLTVRRVPHGVFEPCAKGGGEKMRQLLPGLGSKHRSSDVVNVLSATDQVKFYELTLSQDSDKGGQRWRTRIAVPGSKRRPCFAVHVDGDGGSYTPGVASPLSWESGAAEYIVMSMKMGDAESGSDVKDMDESLSASSSNGTDTDAGEKSDGDTVSR